MADNALTTESANATTPSVPVQQRQPRHAAHCVMLNTLQVLQSLQVFSFLYLRKDGTAATLQLRERNYHTTAQASRSLQGWSVVE